MKHLYVWGIQPLLVLLLALHAGQANNDQGLTVCTTTLQADVCPPELVLNIFLHMHKTIIGPEACCQLLILRTGKIATSSLISHDSQQNMHIHTPAEANNLHLGPDLAALRHGSGFISNCNF